ncbi:MAG: flagellar motor protein MotB [Zetaproteobacteria bacterium CG12_big_fil_rev_8_21_14_0_65_54_13]|nr:MAG: flagellar motor protein MotB [Zetaproteobacteria bacterium CG23_combo_of_CG06-09_8_20_14_all_54_7]PIW48468.1 MAG: flagellar motor protein MotB [Zetaproteobacteria bacterium CG12_big_fil_rev_8_21_14_0_65_54_13]PIX54781.1 MAG: flagellar motor protein MotB [Zetaproteobacteria bacterium CG_4_10_14_3_um_filter_54_28]PJA29663.1 MAG: flagellar motor protein MotB [Zetaproteobacteria bacterium CG_4_9_14_3_um_filter_54_145]
MPRHADGIIDGLLTLLTGNFGGYMKRVLKTVGILGLVGCAAFSSPNAMAAEGSEVGDTGWYLGASAGQAISQINSSKIAAQANGPGVTTTSINEDNRGFGWKAFGGYQFNENFALETGYFDLGRFGFTSITAPAGTLNGDLKAQGVNLDMVGIIPFYEALSAFGRVGLTYAKASDTFTGTRAVTATNKKAWNYKFGGGLEYDFMPSLGMRIEAERYRIKDPIGGNNNIDLYSAGLVYRFGTGSREVAQAEPEPQPVAETPAPMPVTTPAPAPKKVIFSADSADDSLFGFNKSTIRPQGKRGLDSFVEELKGARFEQIIVTGHTDRIGTDAYNQKLSERRADAVKNYLIEAGIPADKITARGVDGSEPMTKPGDCQGTSGNALITCLAPDRRVEVEVDTRRRVE